MRFYESVVEGGGVLTVIEVRDCLQDVAVGVEGLWTADAT